MVKGIVSGSWLRQFHRRVSVGFTANVIANFVARASDLMRKSLRRATISSFESRTTSR
jgi:hypothetical protein